MATPSLNVLHYHPDYHINSASNPTSATHSQSESQSQTPGGSTTGRHQRHSADNPRRTNPTSLSHYQSTEVYLPLVFARESFAAAAFASGYFFYHLRSPHITAFKTLAHDVVAEAAGKHRSTFISITKTIIIALITIFS